jgi:hypothetical protein
VRVIFRPNLLAPGLFVPGANKESTNLDCGSLGDPGLQEPIAEGSGLVVPYR